MPMPDRRDRGSLHHALALGLALSACGGDDSAPVDTGTITVDSSADSTPPDAAIDAVVDAVADAMVDAMPASLESCLPESIPAGGFVSSEVYLETSADACATSVCLVYQLEGIPFGARGCATTEEAADNPECASEVETMMRVHCTCRCDAPPEVMATLCTCPAGFECVDVLMSGGLGVSGSYCIREAS